MAETCKECGCACNQCCQDDQKHGDMHLHVEIEHLRQRLLERDNHIVTMETQFLSEADKFPNGEMASMQEEILRWQDKYSRLYEAHKRVQKVNQNLEDKLLKIVDKCETEKGAFAKDIATLSHRLADANYTIHRLTQDNEKYRNDVNLAIQLLQCKPSNFVGQKYDSLPSEVQAKVRTYVAQKRRSSEAPLPEIKSITVPISTFPPTAMVYNVTKPNADKDSDDEKDESKPPVDIVSAAIMAKVLEDRERERIFAKHCDTCTCHRSILTNDTEVQTINVLDVYICNECGAKNVRNVQNATTDSAGNTESSIQSKDNNIKYNRSTLRSYESDDSSSKHTIFQEFKQNSLNNTKSRFKSPDGNAADTNFQYVKEKTDVQNAQNCETLKIDNSTNDYLNFKNASHRQGVSDASNGKIAKSSQTYPCQSQTDNAIKQSSQKSISKTSADKARQAKHTRKPDFHVGSKFISNDSCNLERNSSQCNRSDLRNPDAKAIRKEQTHRDVINDRLWKNEWSRSKSALNSTNSDRQALGREHRIDIINDRIWKNDKSRMEDGKSAYLTVIEVASTNHAINQNDCKHTENAASPSFSSDSVVISTSDPPSSSSDPVHIVNEKMSAYSNSVKSSWQDRTTGPRNCFVRVTSGSKNILLDNAGHYQTVLYTSGSSKPNTALVHAKSSRSGRSASTSSEENSSILPHDNLQLQRVAEWVQSSSPIDTLSNSSNVPQFRNAVSSKLENNSSIRDNKSKLECSKNLGEDTEKERSNYEKQYNSQLSHVSSELRWEMNSQCSYVNVCDDGVKHESSSQTTTKSKTEIDEDLITFELSNDEKEARSVQDFVKSDSTPELNYEVKITKEMEETYLMLAASLDPVTLHLPSSSGTDLTIEKYRKDHKRVQGQKIQNTSGSSV